jgi:hypothetical protein
VWIQNYGENLYMSGGMNPCGADPVQSWYDEIKFYPKSYGEDATKSATGTVGKI